MRNNELYWSGLNLFSFRPLLTYVDIHVIHMTKTPRPSPSSLHNASDQQLEKAWEVCYLACMYKLLRGLLEHVHAIALENE